MPDRWRWFQSWQSKTGNPKLAKPQPGKIQTRTDKLVDYGIQREVALTDTDTQGERSFPTESLHTEKRLQDELPLPLFSAMFPAVPIQQLAPAALAYLGDAVYELYIRRAYLLPPKRIQAYHHQVVAQVRAERQADQLRSLLPLLTELERDIVKRGRNAATGHPKRVDLNVYQQATSLETLIGYLYLTDPPRLAQLLAQLALDSPAS